MLKFHGQSVTSNEVHYKQKEVLNTIKGMKMQYLGHVMKNEINEPLRLIILIYRNLS